MMSKIQNLNGTHNCGELYRWREMVVYDVKDTKFEWNSQHLLHIWIFRFVVYDVKDTKFEWNSQQNVVICQDWNSCLWCQRYKIWMELTTFELNFCACTTLFMMSKIQNLNGTHNGSMYVVKSWIVVYDVKDTKFEWNSQHCFCYCAFYKGCLWCQRYKIWMELTTYLG